MTTTVAPPVPREYVGREQAYIKHLFLRQYLGRLVHKIGSFADDIVYVDGFSGPWKSGTERYDDTSFGIALNALTEAQDYWSSAAIRPRKVAMSAHLVERDTSAFKQLEAIGPHYPAVRVVPYNNDFLNVVDDIKDAIPPRAFSFVLVDPKGFALDMEKLRPILSRERSEVVFNFMFDFANRFTKLPQLQATFDRLFVGVDWRDELNRLEADPDTTPEARKSAFLRWFKEAVRNVGGFRYVADVAVQYPGKSRTFYYLVYGTRKPPGIEVFRDCQIKALEEQAAVTGRMQVQAVAATGQGFLFDPPEAPRDRRLDAAMEHERDAARQLMIEMIPGGGASIAWDTLWPAVLSEHVISRSSLGREVNALRKANIISVPAWTSNRRQVPEGDYRLSRGDAYPGI